MLRVRQGDESAFSELYRRHYRKVMNFFYGLSRDPALAEELCIETFARIWRLRPRYAATGPFPAYLFSVARNIWLEECRYFNAQRRLGVPVSLEGTNVEVPAPVAGRPDEAAERTELEARLIGAMQQLPEEQRMVIVMRMVERMPIEDIATVMQCPVNTVRSRRLLGLRKLREILRGVLMV